MFKKATHGLVHQTDSGEQSGSLIAVSRLNDSKRLKPLTVVIKRLPAWWWQKPTYRPTDFTLNDVLNGNPIQTELEVNVFTKMYEETQKNDITVSGEVGIQNNVINAQGSRTSKFTASFGTLNTESLNIPHFVSHSNGRKVDLDHILIQQTKGKSNQLLTVLKERIFTTCDCIIVSSGLREGSCSAILQTLNIVPAQIHLKQSANLKYDTNVALEIPPHTVMAYGVDELTIKEDGSFVHCVSEVDGLVKLPKIKEGSSLCRLKDELAWLKDQLCVLANLPSKPRFRLLHLFRDILSEQTLLSALEERLETLCTGKDLYLIPTDLPDASSKLIDTFLDILRSAIDSTDNLFTMPFKQPESLLEMSNQNGARRVVAEGKSAVANHNGIQTTHSNGSLSKAADQKEVLSAMHILVSAAVELTCDGLTMLKGLCSSDMLNWLNYLVTRLTNEPQHIPFTEIPFPQNDGMVPQEVELLFSISNITLRRDPRELWAETSNGNPILPLVLCIVIHGLAYLGETSKVDIEI